MKRNSKIKLILIIFFTILFAFLFWYFYKPSNSSKSGGDGGTNDWGINLFGDEPIKGDQPKSDKPRVEEKTQKYDWEEEMPKLRQISKIPTAGVIFDDLSIQELHKINVEKNIFNTDHAWKLNDHISEIRYVAKKDGYVYSTFTNTFKEKKLTNTIIPKVYRADFWDKNNYIIQYLDGVGKDAFIRTYSIQLKEKTAEEKLIEQILNNDGVDKIKVNQDVLKLNGIFLPTNIQDYSLYPNAKKIFYLESDKNGSIGIISNSDGTEKKQIFKSELKELNVSWNSLTNILVNNKASFLTYSLFFKLNTNGYQNKIIKAIRSGNGLSNYSFSKILISGRDFQGKPTLWSYNMVTKELKDLNLGTFIDKCVWSKNNIDIYCAAPEKIGPQEPDLWYQGYTDFKDSIYKINTETGKQEIIFDKDLYDKNFDIIKLKIDDFNEHLYFIDSKTDFAWSFELDKPTEEEYPIAEEKFDGKLGGGKLCPKNQILTENLKAGDKNGKYSIWAKKKITEAKILQAHMNRLGFSAGKVDGILGKNSDAAIKRMQKYLGTYQDGKVGPITRRLINNSCN